MRSSVILITRYRFLMIIASIVSKEKIYNCWWHTNNQLITLWSCILSYLFIISVTSSVQCWTQSSYLMLFNLLHQQIKSSHSICATHYSLRSFHLSPSVHSFCIARSSFLSHLLIVSQVYKLYITPRQIIITIIIIITMIIIIIESLWLVTC